MSENRFQFVEQTSDVLYTAQIVQKGQRRRIQCGTLGGLKGIVLAELGPVPEQELERIDRVFNSVGERVRNIPEN